MEQPETFRTIVSEIQAMKITPNNKEAVAAWCGGTTEYGNFVAFAKGIQAKRTFVGAGWWIYKFDGYFYCSNDQAFLKVFEKKD